MTIALVKIYARIHEMIHESFKTNIPGLGFLYRRIKSDHVFKVKGKKLFFNHKIADNYGNLINGKFNEKETHMFLDFVFSGGKKGQYHFVDIGGNIGEFVLDYASNSGVKKVTVFEPQPEQQFSIQKTIDLNNFQNARLIKSVVSEEEGEVFFNFNTTNSTASGITNDAIFGQKLIATTLNKEFFDSHNDEVFTFLIDTEGAELGIIKGGKEFIQQRTPLIVFEYNHVTRQHFTIADMQSVLGNNYTLYRLRSDGKLDKDFSRTWNIVALPDGESFEHVKELILRK